MNKGLEELPGKSNYFIGNNPRSWRTNISSYAKVKYKDVYPGIDLVYYGNHRCLEYDFVVAPGANPNLIKLGIEGTTHDRPPLQIDANGDLFIGTESEPIRQHKPLVYQQRDGIRQEISGNYMLTARREVSFQLGSYDKNKPLIIDPVLSYSTYLGGSSLDSGRSIAVDASGNTYVTGSTASPDFPTTTPLQSALSGNGTDVFVAKLTSPGSGLAYSTFLGGDNDDQAMGIAVDSAGNAYVTGTTTSTNFPTSDPLQPALNGNRDAFITKLTAVGTSLTYSTYLGGCDSYYGYGIAIDGSGVVYLTGDTLSGNFPTTPGAAQRDY